MANNSFRVPTNPRAGGYVPPQPPGLGTSFTKSILLVVGGQSLRAGSGHGLKPGADPTLTTSYQPIRTRSLANRQTDPISPRKTKTGSWWPAVIDKLAGAGIDVDVVNAAIGGSSIRQWIGAYRPWAANTAFYAQRSAENGDAGDKGDTIIAGGKLWRCTTGRKRVAYSNGTIDYILPSGSQQSGASAPDWASATVVGNTVTDGTLVWTLLETGTSKSTSDGVAPTSTYGDPLGLCARMGAAADAAIAAKAYDEVWYIWGSASAETPPINGPIFYANDDLTWMNRMKAFADWALDTKLASYASLGLDPWNPALGNSSSTNKQLYEVLDRGLERAINSYEGGSNSGKVVRGPNLYKLFGFTPPVYPETAAPQGIHLTDKGNATVSDEEFRLILAKSAGAVVAPYIADAFNAPFIHISNNPVTTANVGQTVSLFTGNWSGGWTTTVGVQWYRDGIAISGATAATYTLVSGDSGKAITGAITRGNAAGNTTATSAPIAVP